MGDLVDEAVWSNELITMLPPHGGSGVRSERSATRFESPRSTLSPREFGRV